jgi:hypothetical protein
MFTLSITRWYLHPCPDLWNFGLQDYTALHPTRLSRLDWVVLVKWPRAISRVPLVSRQPPTHRSVSDPLSSLLRSKPVIKVDRWVNLSTCVTSKQFRLSDCSSNLLCYFIFKEARVQISVGRWQHVNSSTAHGFLCAVHISTCVQEKNTCF